MKDWRFWVGLFLLLTGLALRDVYHFQAAQDWVFDVAEAFGNPSGPPACVFDCAPNPTGDTAYLGRASLLVILVGIMAIIWSKVRAQP